MTGSIAASDHWIASKGGKLFARAWVPPDARLGTGPAILLFHDSLGCVDLWRDFPPQLTAAARLPVIAYDRLGFGRSDPRTARQPLSFIGDEAADAVPRLCDSLGLGELIPFGHSVGGAMAIATAAHTPARCLAVVTVSTQSFVEERTLAGIRTAAAGFQNADQFNRLARYHGPKARRVLDNWIETWLDPAFADWRLDDDLRRVRCPVLALHGDRDEYGSRNQPERIASLAPGPSRAVILGGCGHVPHREQPARVLDEVARFLNRQSRPDSR